MSDSSFDSIASKEKQSHPMHSNKFLKWSESSNIDKVNIPVGVSLKLDKDSHILYWTDYSKKSDYLDIAFIRDVRNGKYANLPKDKSVKDVLSNGELNTPIEEKTISIYYGNDFVNLQCINFVSVATNASQIAKEWTTTLLRLITCRKIHNLSPYENLNKLRSILLNGKSVHDEKAQGFIVPVQTIVDSFVTSDKIHSETEKQHVCHMLQSVNLPCGKSDVLNDKILTQEKFFQLFLRLVSKEEIEKIFASYGTKKKLSMTVSQFQRFLNDEQRDPRLNELLYPYYTLERAAEMIHKFESDDTFRKKKLLSPQGLIRFLMDEENEVVDPKKFELCDDMEKPLSHYFINSSHNTYLTGHQVTGRSEVEMYRQVLLSGCRCIELDCWDDKTLNEPVITHGMTLCTIILFKDAIEAIKESAFRTSPYPVLLSFENHCSKAMQQKMAKYLLEILGDLLLIDELPQYPLKPGSRLPSPEDLKYKILIKNKKCLNNDDKISKSNMKLPRNSIDDFDANITSFIPSKSEDLISETQTTGKLAQFTENGIKISLSQKKLSQIFSGSHIRSRNLSQTIDSDVESDKSDIDDDRFYITNNNSPEKVLEVPAKEMSNLVNYLQPVDFHSFEYAEKNNKSYELSSFIETKAYSIHKEKSSEFVNYNKRQLSRIYPKSTRIASDNFMPQVYWNVGCQLVALNFQTLDVGMKLNLGKFELNNKIGYLLKPEAMRRVDNKSFDPFAESPLDGIVAATVTIQVISGVFLTDKHDKRLGQTVLVEMFGLPADTRKGQRAYQAKMTSSNTFNVIYSDSVFSFRKIIMPELASLCFTAYDDQSKVIGQRVLPIIGLRPGYRYICLRNESNQLLNMSMLFVNIKVKDYVPDKFVELADALVDPIRYVSNLDKKEELLKSLTDENDVKEEACTLSPQPIKNTHMGEFNHANSLGVMLKSNQSTSVNNLFKASLSIDMSTNTSCYSFEDYQMKDKTSPNSFVTSDPSMFEEIDIEQLKKIKSFVQISKLHSKKVTKMQTEAEKKIMNFVHNFNAELVKKSAETEKLKQKILREYTGPEKSTKTSFTLHPGNNNAEYNAKIEKIEKEHRKNIDLLREDFIKKKREMHFNLLQNIYDLNIASLNPLYDHLKKLVVSISDFRLNHLRMKKNKDIAKMNKKVHEQIKQKKKDALKTSQDKDEFQRLSREIEKDLVTTAVTENQKIEDLLKLKEKLVEQTVERALNVLKEHKENQKAFYENEMNTKMNTINTELEAEYLRHFKERKIDERSPNVSINRLKNSQNDNKSEENFRSSLDNNKNNKESTYL